MPHYTRTFVHGGRSVAALQGCSLCVATYELQCALAVRWP